MRVTHQLVSVLSSVFVSFFLAGCATIINGRYQDVTITTNPPGASCTAGNQTLKTPVVAELRRSDEITVSCALPGYFPASTQLTRNWTFFGIYDWFFYIVPGLVDQALGTNHKFVPSEVALTLNPKESPESGIPPSQGLSVEEIAKLAVAVANAKTNETNTKSLNSGYHSSIDEPNYHELSRPNDFAIVVGVEKYAQNLPEAKFAERDAMAFQHHLIALGVPPRHIAYLAGERASRSALVMNVNRWLPSNVKPDSRVYFYFSGHGAPDSESGDAYIVPFDGNPEDLEDTAYSLRGLYAKLSALKARRVIVALDSCFSGAGGRSVIAKGARPLMTRVSEGSVPESGKIVVLTASKSDQTTGVIEEKGHGAFTYYLLKGLNGKALGPNGHVSAQSLYAYLKPKVEDAAHLDNRDQSPQMLPSSVQSGQDQVNLR